MKPQTTFGFFLHSETMEEAEEERKAAEREGNIRRRRQKRARQRSHAAVVPRVAAAAPAAPASAEAEEDVCHQQEVVFLTLRAFAARRVRQALFKRARGVHEPASDRVEERGQEGRRARLRHVLGREDRVAKGVLQALKGALILGRVVGKGEAPFAARR